MAVWIKMKRIMVKFVIHLLTNYAITSPKIAEARLRSYDNVEIHISFTASFESKVVLHKFIIRFTHNMS